MTLAVQADRAAFLALGRTTAIQRQDYSAWHRGRAWYAVWVVDFVDVDILAYLRQLREHFADMLFNPCARQPHVTVFVSGFWVQQAQWDDDYTPAQYQAQQRRLQHLDLPAFAIGLGAINSFASALYVEVHDLEQGLATVRQALAEVMPELRWGPYIPHVTIGVYRAALPTAAVVQRMQRSAPQCLRRVRVQGVHLVTYAARELLGPLHTRYTHSFGRTTAPDGVGTGLSGLGQHAGEK
ncbi:MAG: 2'-5' RNA ligase family protein [Candidatus Tectimicrobiota bacterium]